MKSLKSRSITDKSSEWTVFTSAQTRELFLLIPGGVCVCVGGAMLRWSVHDTTCCSWWWMGTTSTRVYVRTYQNIQSSWCSGAAGVITWPEASPNAAGPVSPAETRVTWRHWEVTGSSLQLSAGWHTEHHRAAESHFKCCNIDRLMKWIPKLLTLKGAIRKCM